MFCFPLSVHGSMFVVGTLSALPLLKVLHDPFERFIYVLICTCFLFLFINPDFLSFLVF